MFLGLVYTLVTSALMYALGRILVAGEIRNLRSRRNNAIEFSNRLNTTMRLLSQRKDFSEDYAWLQLHVDTLDREMGIYSIIGWKPPGCAPGYSQRANVLRQGLAEIPRLRGHFGLFEDDAFWPQQMHSAILQYVGNLDEKINTKARNLTAFFPALARGIRYSITFPARLFLWSGLINERAFQKFEDGPLASLLTGVTLLGGLLAGIVTILQKWDEVLKLVRR